MIMAFMVNAMIGATAASALGAPLALGAVGALMAGNASVLTEVWTGELIKQLRSADKGTFLDGIPDYSKYANNDVIHMINVGGDPKVLTNNTTYPLQITVITDTDAVFKLDKFQTEATPITDDELYALSYDKMASVKERHGLAILEAKLKKAIHALAPASNTATTPVIKTTGEVEDGGATGRKRLTRHDIIEMKKRFDLMSVPTEGRRLVLCPEHIADLLEMDQKFAEQYYNYASGRISMLYGFEVYEYVAGPVSNLTGAKHGSGRGQHLSGLGSLPHESRVQGHGVDNVLLLRGQERSAIPALFSELSPLLRRPAEEGGSHWCHHFRQEVNGYGSESNERESSGGDTGHSV